jgi:hypothetical protein
MARNRGFKKKSYSKKSSADSKNSSTGSNVVPTALGVGGMVMIGHSMGGLFPPKQYRVDESDNNPCDEHFENFKKCLYENKTQIANCQWVYDQILQCTENKQY